MATVGGTIAGSDVALSLALPLVRMREEAPVLPDGASSTTVAVTTVMPLSDRDAVACIHE